MTTLPRDFYDRGADAVARDLLGRLLVRSRDGVAQVGRVVEAEAYLGPHDRASHSSKGRTRRTAVMFGPPGMAYVYLIYGMHHCLNVVTGAEGLGAAVLIRALEPVSGIEAATSGPGRLCRTLGIDRSHDGLDLTRDESDLRLAEPVRPGPPIDVAAGPRVGVAYAGEWASAPLRFWARGNPFVSRPSR